ncbi:MAG: methyltransferase type 12 [uncultured bacterium]|nr:MAG: methyltransferase type 12 [uncultured bacterium]
MVKKSPVCNLCGSKDVALYLVSPNKSHPESERYSTTSQKVAGEKLVICANCGLVFVDPMPAKQTILAQYSQNSGRAYLFAEKGRLNTFERAIKLIQKYKKHGRLLDVGAAGGLFLKVAKDHGYNVLGVEPNVNLAKVASGTYGVKVVASAFESTQFRQKFDIITFWDTLEHINNPKSTLIKACQLLTKGGIVVINYPDIKSLWAKFFGRNWWFVVSGHLYYFSMATLNNYLESTGFKAIENKKHWQTLDFAYLVYQLKRYNQPAAEFGYRWAKRLKLDRLSMPYWAGQTTTVAFKAMEAKC